MNKFSSIFGQILQIFSKNEFYKAVKESKADKGVRDLWEWINKPFETLPIVPDIEQLTLKGF